MHDFNGSFYGVFWTFAENSINFIMCFEGVVSRCAVIYDADFLKCTTVLRKTYVFKPPQSQAEPHGRPGSQVAPGRARQPGRDRQPGKEFTNSRRNSLRNAQWFFHGDFLSGWFFVTVIFSHGDFWSWWIFVTMDFCHGDFLSRWIFVMVDSRRGSKTVDFRWDASTFGDSTCDFSWEVLKLTISMSRFMMCFRHLLKNI